MKYRIQMDAVFNNSDANSILDHIESIKTKVYTPIGSELVEIILKSNKCDIGEVGEQTEYDFVDFTTEQETHTTNHSGTEFQIKVDVSFVVLQDYYDLLNYIETIKSSTINTAGYVRDCRFFQCNHDESPLIKDGTYSYIDFDGTELTHS